MKRVFQNFITVFFVGVVVAGVSAGEARGQGVLNEILKRMDDHNRALTSLRANVTMAKQNAQLGDDPEVTIGTANYLPRKGKDPLVRIDWKRPEESLAVVDKKYVIYRPRLNQAYTGNTEKAKGNAKANGALSFMSMSRAELKANYTVAYLGEGKLSDGTNTFHLELTPKTAASYKKAEVWVDANGMPLQSKITENNNDTTTVLLTNLEKNINIPASVFKIVLPKGTKIIQS